MTHYERNYTDLPEDKKDAAAIADAKQYLGAKAWETLLFLFADETVTCRQLDLALCIAGVRGFPVFAIMRKFRRVSYDAWYASLPED